MGANGKHQQCKGRAKGFANSSTMCLSVDYYLCSFARHTCSNRMRHNFILFCIENKSVYKSLKESANDLSDLQLFSSPDKDAALACARKFVAKLYDQRNNFKSFIMALIKCVSSLPLVKIQV